MAITGVVSGGQTGADQAGLRAAARLKLKTGGYAPKDFRTDCGNMPWLAASYGLIDCGSDDYSVRTELNVSLSTGTVIFGQPSAGSNLTAQLCKDLGRPCCWVKELDAPSTVARFHLWAERNHITILNVAGNRERKCPGIGLAVERFLLNVLPLVK